jgi:phosphoribosylformylglycinamidine synthase subunit PurS
MIFVATIRVLPKAEVRDPQGEAVRGALRSLGLAVSDVRTGKEIVVTFEAASEVAAREAVRLMGNELLANPVIEDYAYELKEVVAPAPAETAPRDPAFDLAGAGAFEPASVDDIVYGEREQTGER